MPPIKSSAAPDTAPTPMPAFAPVDKLPEELPAVAGLVAVAVVEDNENVEATDVVIALDKVEGNWAPLNAAILISDGPPQQLLSSAQHHVNEVFVPSANPGLHLANIQELVSALWKTYHTASFL